MDLARQSLDSRLAAAAVANSNLAAATQRASMDSNSLHNNSASPLSPYTKSTTVRRTSTSLIHVNGEVSWVVGGKGCQATALCTTA